MKVLPLTIGSKPRTRMQNIITKRGQCRSPIHLERRLSITEVKQRDIGFLGT